MNLCVRVSGPSVYSQSWFIRRREHFKTGADFFSIQTLDLKGFTLWNL